MPGVPPRYRGRPGGRLHRSPPLKVENCSFFFLVLNLIQVFFLHAHLSHTGVYHLPDPSELRQDWQKIHFSENLRVRKRFVAFRATTLPEPVR